MASCDHVQSCEPYLHDEEVLALSFLRENRCHIDESVLEGLLPFSLLLVLPLLIASLLGLVLLLFLTTFLAKLVLIREVSDHLSLLLFLLFLLCRLDVTAEPHLAVACHKSTIATSTNNIIEVLAPFELHLINVNALVF